MGFTQRQAAGKFTRDEAEEFIERLEIEVHGDGPPADSRPPKATRTVSPRPSKIGRRPSEPKRSSTDIDPNPDLEDVPSDVLAAELQRRGWAVLEP